MEKTVVEKTLDKVRNNKAKLSLVPKIVVFDEHNQGDDIRAGCLRGSGTDENEFKTLMEMDEEKYSEDGYLPIHDSVRRGDVTAFFIHLKKGGDLLALTHSQPPQTCLTLALSKWNPTMVTLLLNFCPQLMAVNPRFVPGFSPLASILMRRDNDISNLALQVLQHGWNDEWLDRNVNIKDLVGGEALGLKGPLHWGAINGGSLLVEMVNMELGTMTGPTSVDKYGFTPIHYLASSPVLMEVSVKGTDEERYKAISHVLQAFELALKEQDQRCKGANLMEIIAEVVGHDASQSEESALMEGMNSIHIALLSNNTIFLAALFLVVFDVSQPSKPSLFLASPLLPTPSQYLLTRVCPKTNEDVQRGSPKTLAWLLKLAYLKRSANGFNAVHCACWGARSKRRSLNCNIGGGSALGLLLGVTPTGEALKYALFGADRNGLSPLWAWLTSEGSSDGSNMCGEVLLKVAQTRTREPFEWSEFEEEFGVLKKGVSDSCKRIVIGMEETDLIKSEVDKLLLNHKERFNGADGERALSLVGYAKMIGSPSHVVSLLRYHSGVVLRYAQKLRTDMSGSLMLFAYTILFLVFSAKELAVDFRPTVFNGTTKLSWCAKHFLFTLVVVIQCIVLLCHKPATLKPAVSIFQVEQKEKGTGGGRALIIDSVLAGATSPGFCPVCLIVHKEQRWDGAAGQLTADEEELRRKSINMNPKVLNVKQPRTNTKCGGTQPIHRQSRAHHCSKCGRCVMGFDCHDSDIGNDIDIFSRRRHIVFAVSLLVHYISGVLVIIRLIVSKISGVLRTPLRKLFEHYIEAEEKLNSSIWLHLFGYIINGVRVSAIGFILLFIQYLMMRKSLSHLRKTRLSLRVGMTRHEFETATTNPRYLLKFEAERGNESVEWDNIENPWDKGKWVNMFDMITGRDAHALAKGYPETTRGSVWQD